MFYHFFNNLIFNYVFTINIISLYKYNCIILKEFILFDFIAKVKINGIGYQNILSPEIINYYNRKKFPDEIYIEKENNIKRNISNGTYYIYLEDDENSVIMKWNTNLTSTRNMFYNCSNITEIDLTEFDLTLITNMGNMFYNCYNLTKVFFGNYDTPNLNKTYGMFSGCYNLPSIDLSTINTSNVDNMKLMFINAIL